MIVCEMHLQDCQDAVLAGLFRPVFSELQTPGEIQKNKKKSRGCEKRWNAANNQSGALLPWRFLILEKTSIL